MKKNNGRDLDRFGLDQFNTEFLKGRGVNGYVQKRVLIRWEGLGVGKTLRRKTFLYETNLSLEKKGGKDIQIQHVGAPEG